MWVEQRRNSRGSVRFGPEHGEGGVATKMADLWSGRLGGAQEVLLGHV